MKRVFSVKKILPAVMIWTGLASIGHAAIYEYPVDDPQLKAVARFPMEPLQTGNDRISYKLPDILTGVPVRVEMTKQFDVGNTRVYQGPNVSGECEGPLDQPKCRVEFFDLNLATPQARAARRQAAERVYADPAMLSAAIRVGDLFAEQQPIGIIDAQSGFQALDLPGSRWNFEYFVNGNRVSGEMCFYQENPGTGSEKLAGVYRVGQNQNCYTSSCQTCNSNCQLCGTVDKLHIYGEHLKGRWQAGSTWGWIDFSFQGTGSQDRRFRGTYGFEDQRRRSGQWNGWLKR